MRFGSKGYQTQRPSRAQRDTFTWANKPSATAYPPFRTVRITDFGRSFTTANKGSEWYTDGTNWRPAKGSQLIYTLGSASVAKTSTLTTPEILAQILIPAGALATVDSQLTIVSAYTKSASTDTMNNSYYFGSAGTTADALIVSVAQNTASRQGQTERFIQRVNATNIILQYSGNSAFSTGTSTPPTNLTVSNLDSVAQYLSIALHLSAGTTETMNLVQFDVRIEG